MKWIFLTIIFSFPILTFSQNNIKELTVKKEGFLNQINSLKDSVKAVEVKILYIESETIHAKITEDNFIPIRTKVNENYSPFYKNEKMLDSFVLLTVYDYVNVIGISTTNTDLAKVQYQGNLGFIPLANLDISAADKKIIDAIIRPIIDAQKKASSEKLESQKKAEELREKYMVERSQRSRDSIVQRLSDLRIKEAEDLKIAKVRRIAKNKADEISRQEAEVKRKGDLIKTYGETIATRLLKKELWIGMTAQMARESIGSPIEVNRTVFQTVIKEQWVYSIKNLLYFENNILVSWQD